MKHFAVVAVKMGEDELELVIDCRTCGRSTFKTAKAHLDTLARVLPKVCEQAGINLDPEATVSFVQNYPDDTSIEQVVRDARGNLDAFIDKRTRHS